VSILKKISHSGIIRYIESFFSSDGRKLCIVMEFANRGTLENNVQAKNCSFQEFCIWRYVYQISSAIDYLHRHRVLHRDLKPANVLGVEDWNPVHNEIRIRWKIADFGIAKLLNRDAQGNYYGGDLAGTPKYMAPEVN
jgi:serine/threonine protein kinase